MLTSDAGASELRRFLSSSPFPSLLQLYSEANFKYSLRISPEIQLETRSLEGRPSEQPLMPT